MKRVIAKHKENWSDRDFVQSVFFGFLFLVISLVLNYYASMYATTHAGNFVQDILLDNLPVFNVDFIVTDGAVMFAAYLVLLVLLEPRKLPFVAKATALFITIRAAFIMFTHLGVIPNQSYLDPADMFRQLVSGGDYFFSGHTGMPFLFALMFWKEFWPRVVCLSVSIIFALAVIFGHLHYTIDVFSAYFITYTIYVLAKQFFPRDLKQFTDDEPTRARD